MPAINEAFAMDDKTLRHACGGLRIEGTTVLQPLTILHRFVARADVSNEVYVASPWWFQASAVRKVLEAARSGHRDDFTAQGQASKGAGLSEKWKQEEPCKVQSGSHYLLTVKTIAPLVTFWGAPRAVGAVVGRPKEASGLKFEDDVAEVEVVPDPRCVQFYIPGMRDIAFKAVAVVSKTKMKHSTDLAGGDIEVFLRKAAGER